MFRIACLPCICLLAMVPSTLALAQSSPHGERPPANEGEAGGAGRGDSEGAMREEELDDERAQSHFRIGSSMYRSGRFVEAAREFERAYGLSGRPAMLFNAYLAYRDAAELERAVVTLRAYLAEAPESEETPILRSRLEALEATLAAEREQEEQARREREAHAEERRRLEAEQERLRREHADAIDHPVAPWVVTSVGGALLVGSGIAAIIAGGRVDDLEEQCPLGRDRCPPELDLAGERAEARRAVIATDVMLFTGAATALTGAILLVVEYAGGDSPPPVEAGCTAAGCEASVEVRF